MGLVDKLLNTLVRLPLDGTVSPVFNQICTVIGLVQIVGALTDMRSYVWKMTMWTYPQLYISLPFTIITGTVLTLLYTLLIIVKLAGTDPNESIVRDNKKSDTFGTLIAYLRVIVEKIVFAPLIKGCVEVFVDGSDGGLTGLAVFALTLYLLVVYLISLFCSTDTTALTANFDRKFSFFNVELFFNIFKLLFVVLNPISSTAVFSLCPVYVVAYFALLINKPFFAYTDQNFRRSVYSIVAFLCLVRLFNAIFLVYKGSLFVEVAGGGSFAGIVEWLCLGLFVSEI